MTTASKADEVAADELASVSDDTFLYCQVSASVLLVPSNGSDPVGAASFVAAISHDGTFSRALRAMPLPTSGSVGALKPAIASRSEVVSTSMP